MKKFFMAIVLCFVWTVSFAQESRYIKVTDTITDFMQCDYDFIIAKKLNGKNIAVFNCEYVGTRNNSSILLKMDTDSSIICSDTLSLCVIGSAIARTKDYKYLNLNSNSECFQDQFIKSTIVSNGNCNFLIYQYSNYVAGYDNYLYLKYDYSNNKFIKNTISCNYNILNKFNDSHFTLEIYKRVDSMTSSVHEINSNLSNIKNSKIIKNGKIVIIKGDKEYDILGNLLQ